jgi:hypothetical protein
MNKLWKIVLSRLLIRLLNTFDARGFVRETNAVKLQSTVSYE